MSLVLSPHHTSTPPREPKPRACHLKRNDLIALANCISTQFPHCLQGPGSHFPQYYVFLAPFQLLGLLLTFEDQPEKRGDSSRTDALAQALPVQAQIFPKREFSPSLRAPLQGLSFKGIFFLGIPNGNFPFF